VIWGRKRCPDHALTDDPLANTRSRLTNHRDLTPGLDGRSPEARRFRDLVRAFVRDMGGVERCSEVKLGLARRLAAASVLVETMETKVVTGEPIDVSEFCNLASTTVRLSSRLGVERVPRDVTPPSPSEYIAHIQKQKQEAAP
jgi:hypothetical protein